MSLPTIDLSDDVRAFLEWIELHPEATAEETGHPEVADPAFDAGLLLMRVPGRFYMLSASGRALLKADRKAARNNP